MRALKHLAGTIALLALCAPASASDLAVLRNGFSIRHEYREGDGVITRLYLTADGSSYADIATAEIDHFEKDMTPAVKPAAPAAPRPQDLSDAIAASSLRHKIDPDLITSVIHAESGFNPHAVSPKGAQGLMQLMPQTASRLGVTNAFDPKANVDGGTRYLRELLVRYDFDLIKTLAAYNAGPRRVEQFGGVPPYAETRAYVRKIVLDYNRKKLAQKKVAQRTAVLKPAPKKMPATGTTRNQTVAQEATTSGLNTQARR